MERMHVSMKQIISIPLEVYDVKDNKQNMSDPVADGNGIGDFCNRL